MKSPQKQRKLKTPGTHPESLEKSSDQKLGLVRPQKLRPTFFLEHSYRKDSTRENSWVIGIDEVGRGCIAGPVVVAAVAFKPCDWGLDHESMNAIQDSKKISPEKRAELSEWIHARAGYCKIIQIDSQTVDRINILRATLEGFKRLILQAKKDLTDLDAILIDGNQTVRELGPSQIGTHQYSVVKGDQKSKSIAAASIVAKVFRDNLLIDYSKAHPGYGFENHKGYGTSDHYEAIDRLGILDIHRRSFLKNWERSKFGAWAERKVAEHLNASGFEVLAKNWSRPEGEIDLIAKRGDCIHFVEVRARADANLEMALPVTKQKQFRSMGVEFIKESNQSGRLSGGSKFQFDFALVAQDKIEMHWDVFAW